MSILELNASPKVTKLSNGLRVATMKIKSDISTFGYWVKSGSMYETPENNGVSHYLEHILFRGNDKYSESALERLADSKGINLLASTSRATTNFFATVSNETAGLATEVLSEIILNPDIKEIKVENERETILTEEYDVSHDLNEMLFEKLFETAFPKTSCGFPILGPSKNIKTITAEMLRQHHKDYFNIDNMYFVAATPIPHEEVCEMVERATKFVKKPNEERKIKPSDDKFWPQEFVSQSRTYTCSFFDNESMVGLMFKFPKVGDPDFVPSQLFRCAFGDTYANEFSSSPLFKNPIIHYGSTTYAPCNNMGTLLFLGKSPADKEVDWINIVNQNMTKIITDKETFNMAKLASKYQFVFGLTSPKVIADEVGINLLLQGKMKTINQWSEELNKVTQQSLIPFYEKYHNNGSLAAINFAPPPQHK